MLELCSDPCWREWLKTRGVCDASGGEYREFSWMDRASGHRFDGRSDGQ